MERYEKLLPVLDRILTDTTHLHNGDYGAIATEDGELQADTETIQASTANLRDHIARMNDMEETAISGLAHDLRGMMNGILGWAEIIIQGLDGDLTAEQEAVYRRILTDGQFSLVQIDTLIDHARFKIGKLAIKRAPTNLHEVFEPELRLYRSHPPQVSTVHIAAGLDIIESDPARLRQMAYHLVQNAHRHGNANAVETHVSQADGTLIVQVWDDGRGIPPEHLPHVTEAFYQADPSVGGLGLGLALVERLAAAFGGTLTVESADGTTVTVQLPL